MATILLDSPVIFDHLNGRFGRTEFLDELVEQDHLLACCAVNITEVYAGLRPGEEEKTAAFIVAMAHGSPLLTDNGRHFPEEGLDMWPLPPAG